MFLSYPLLFGSLNSVPLLFLHYCKLSCPHDNVLSFVFKRNQGFLTAVVICECSRNFSGSGWEVGLAFHLKGCSASGRHGAMIGKWGFL